MGICTGLNTHKKKQATLTFLILNFMDNFQFVTCRTFNSYKFIYVFIWTTVWLLWDLYYIALSWFVIFIFQNAKWAQVHEVINKVLESRTLHSSFIILDNKMFCRISKLCITVWILKNFKEANGNLHLRNRTCHLPSVDLPSTPATHQFHVRQIRSPKPMDRNWTMMCQ